MWPKWVTLMSSMASSARQLGQVWITWIGCRELPYGSLPLSNRGETGPDLDRLLKEEVSQPRERERREREGKTLDPCATDFERKECSYEQTLPKLGSSLNFEDRSMEQLAHRSSLFHLDLLWPLQPRVMFFFFLLDFVEFQLSKYSYTEV